MPNWCACTLILTGSDAALQQFKTSMEKMNEDGKYVPFSFNQTLPRPKSHPDLCDWSVKHWGTKWDAENPEIITTPSSIQMFFSTAWSPPIAWLETVIPKFAGLRANLAYCEIGTRYYGRLMISEDGSKITEQYDMKDADIEEVLEDDEVVDIKPAGKLLEFMEKHEMPLCNLGG
jgi:hypothetical protein